MSSIPFSFTEFESTRKKWLNSFFTYYIVIYLSYSFNYALALFPAFPSVQNYLGWALIAFILPMGILGLGLYITYRCAYEKHGTAWLQFLIIVMPLRQLSDYTKLTKAEVSQNWPLMIIISIVLVNFLVNCNRLRKMNLIRNKLDSELSTSNENLK